MRVLLWDFDGTLATRNGGRTGYEKPHPEAFMGVLRRLPSNSTVWMVGDSFAADVQGAERVGLPAILVRNRQDGVTTYCDSLTGIEGILRTQPAIPGDG